MPGPGDTPLVALRLPPRDLAAAAVAAWAAGEAVLPLDPRAPDAALRAVLDALAPTDLVDADGRRTLPGGEPVADDVVVVIATSGTTGAPKGVELTRTGMEAAARAYTAGCGLGPDDAWLACLPMHHVAGLATVARGVVTGLRVVVHEGFDVERVGRAPDDEGATAVLVVPTMLRRLVDAGAPIERYARIVVGAGPMPAALRAAAEERGARVVHTYGMTETWGGIALDGIPLGGVDVRADADGELRVRGPMVMRGYRRRPDLTAAAIDPDGWLRTGDLGRVIDGRVEVVGRRKDLVITGGVNVVPTEVEDVLGAHPAVADVAVVGAPDEEWGERVVACVALHPGVARPTLDELRDFARDRLPAAKLPRELRVVDAVPRTPGGKLRRAALRDEGP